MNLIENAKDSLEHAVQHFAFDGEQYVGDLKRVLVDLSHVVELILKERLARVHPAFVWNNVDKYPSTQSYTVPTEIAVERLTKIANIKFSEKERKTIFSCRVLRNDIEHFRFEIEKKEAEIIIGRILSFIFNFSRKELGLTWEQEFKNKDNWDKLIELYEFWEAHSETVEQELVEKEVPIFECPSCRANTYNLNSMQCELCNHAEELVECDACKGLTPESQMDGVMVDEHTDIAVCQNCLHREEHIDYYDYP